jgi:hypothetical protein
VLGEVSMGVGEGRGAGEMSRRGEVELLVRFFGALSAGGRVGWVG